MNYAALKTQMNERLEELIDKRNELREISNDYVNDFDYAKLTGQIISMYEVIIMVQEMEIEELSGKEDK